MAEKTKMSRRNKIAAGAGLLVAVGLIGGTFAWLSSSDEKVNHFEGGVSGNDVAINEVWTPPTNWLPGQEVVKEVSIMNTGKYGEFVRVTFDEKLELLENGAATLIDQPSANDMLIPTDVSSYTSNGYTEGTLATPIVKEGYTLHVLEKAGKAQVDPETGATSTPYSYISYWEKDGHTFIAKFDSKVAGDGVKREENGSLTVTNPKFEAVNGTYAAAILKNWATEKPATAVSGPNASLADANISIQLSNLDEASKDNAWFYNASDGWFYYTNVLTSGASTPDIMKSVTLSENADDKYAAMKYDLTIKAEALQPVAKAAESEWGVNGAILDRYKAVEVKSGKDGQTDALNSEGTSSSEDGSAGETVTSAND